MYIIVNTYVHHHIRIHTRVSFRKMGKGGQNNTYEKHGGGGQRECA